VDQNEIALALVVEAAPNFPPCGMGIPVAASDIAGIHGTTGAGPFLDLDSSIRTGCGILRSDNCFGSKRFRIALDAFMGVSGFAESGERRDETPVRLLHLENLPTRLLANV
jgi:hypothetical protein